jgi:hypothetical protein
MIVAGLEPAGPRPARRERRHDIRSGHEAR